MRNMAAIPLGKHARCYEVCHSVVCDVLCGRDAYVLPAACCLMHVVVEMSYMRLYMAAVHSLMVRRAFASLCARGPM